MRDVPNEAIHIQEVGMRDGLQSADQFVETEDKIRLLNQLSQTGLSKIEVTSFVSPKAVPLLADAEDVLRAIERSRGVTYSALIPNIRGLERALSVDLDEVNVVMSVSNAHNMANLRMTCEESLNQFREICANRGPLKVNGTLATAFGCPFVGSIEPTMVLEWARRYMDTGIDSLTLADTVGTATPHQIFHICKQVVDAFPDVEVTLHLHNTRGLGIANALAGIDAGIRHLDASIGGIGGCPYAPGATGNVCTEDLVHALIFDGYRCDVDLEALIDIAGQLEDLLSDPLPGLVRHAGSKITKHPMSDDLRCRLGLPA
jgi:hydroxymethylglutaryl-CoA lyase